MNGPVRTPELRTRIARTGLQHNRDGTCVAEVELALGDGRSETGQGSAPDVPAGHLRAGARGAIAALDRLLAPRVSLELKGAKLVRAFDTRVAIVVIRVTRGSNRTNLLGAVEVKGGDLGRSGVLATLDAVNRHLAPDLAGDLHRRRPPGG